MSFIVAIDGPAGTGKGTVTEIISKKFKLLKIDTGATYRCVALMVIKNNYNIDDVKKIEELLPNIDIEFKRENGEEKVILNGEDVTKEIRSKEVNKIVSQVSAIIPVRLYMAELQRKMAKGKDVIMEGRDITTVVLPNADIKIFLTASPEERAKRRFKEWEGMEQSAEYAKVLEEIKKRDEMDMTRKESPLLQSEDAVLLDTTGLSLEQVADKIGEMIMSYKNKN